MVQDQHGPETSHETRVMQRLHVLYARKTQERQIFMEDLNKFRKDKEKRLIKEMIVDIGPTWYQVLSVPQRQALDTLKSSIHQDLLEGRPGRSATIMQSLGLYPRPNDNDLLNCVYLGRRDPKEMLAQLFLIFCGYPIDYKMPYYGLNARLLLSAIFYLGLEQLLTLLRDRFRPEPIKKIKVSKPKTNDEISIESPYLQKMIAVLYLPPELKQKRPLPLPNLDELNEPYEEELNVVAKPAPLPPPPPAPKKRLARSYCDKLAGIIRIEPYVSETTVSKKIVTRTVSKKLRNSKFGLSDVKKSYGVGVSRGSGTRRRKPTIPSTGLWSAQFVICGVYSIHGKTVYVLGNVSILPPQGELIHLGHRNLQGEYINIHGGFRGRPPPPKPDPCDCLKRWHDNVFNYLKTTKCYCGHHYDLGNEGIFPSDELSFFEKPTRKSGYTFDYHTIFDMDPKSLLVAKEFKKIWDTDSTLHVDDGTVKDDKKDKKKKKTRKASTTCLGETPKPEDYLKCALRHMRQINIAARLPDLHLVPELKEWMRRRIYGSYSPSQRAELLRNSGTKWKMIDLMARRGYGHVSTSQDPRFSGHTTWIQKLELNDKFRKYTGQYKLQLFRAQAKFTNLLWPTMCQAQFPDKKFREIYFSYLFSRLEDMYLMHPFSSREAVERKVALNKRAYRCPPAGVEKV